ncbi:foldase [Faecalibacterium prausnitzii]|uniref:foldase n=1 Tax=Faecalibacterium prausnitzii TaxID=853 RepID=UPI0012DEEEA7|nr:foldase [Faecalibacterium prausnitzii]
MKKKLIALLAAVAMVFSLAACGSTPDSVGTIGTVDITSGLYLLAQYDAYQKAADLATSEQDAADVKAFLKQTITVDADSGETATVSDYVSQKTMENLETYAAIETRFEELGGQLTAEEEAQADSYASQLMEQYGDTYKANGIGLNTVQRFERILIKSSDLLELVYGVDGETPVSDADLTSHLENNMYELAYYTIPLYNTSTYAFADDDQTTEMLNLTQPAIDDVNSYAATLADLSDSTNSSMLMGAFSGVVTSALPGIYKVLDSTYSSDSDAPSLELIGDSTVTSAFTAEGAADTVRSLSIGQAAALKYNGYAMMAVLRLDPLSLNALDNLRTQVLNDMKSEELTDALAEYGASLEHNLNSSAMNKMPASKIVNSSTN